LSYLANRQTNKQTNKNRTGCKSETQVNTSVKLQLNFQSAADVMTSLLLWRHDVIPAALHSGSEHVYWTISAHVPT